MAEDNIFNDKEFAQRYAERHQKMANSFGNEYARKLKARGFSSGKILDAGCGFGGTLLHLAPAPGYVGALAVRAPPGQVTVRTGSWELSN